MLAKRRQMDPHDRESVADSAAKILLAHSLFEKSQHIACYFSTEEEFDTAPIIRDILQAQKRCYLPVLLPEKSLCFSAFKRGDELKLNRYSILEPVNSDVFPAEKLDLVLLPLVAFDLEGRRLGMGGGYYDRTFSFKKTSQKQGPFLLGIGFEDQRVESLSSDIWDVNLDGVLTGHRLIILNRHTLLAGPKYEN